MSLPRMHLDPVLLPDRTVFVSGGALAREERVGARLQSKVYGPVADQWRATVAPPGWYMILLLGDTGVPSVASWLRLA